MNKLRTPHALFIALFLGSSAHAFKAPVWTNVEQFNYSWQKDPKSNHHPKSSSSPHSKELPVASITLQVPKGWDDPGEFLRILIQTQDSHDTAFDQFEGVKLSEPFRSYAIDKKQYLAAVPFSGKDAPAMLVVEDYDYPSQAPIIHVIHLMKNFYRPDVQAQKLFVYSKSIEDVDHDGTLELVGTRSYSDPTEFSPRVRAYVPYLVYKLIGDQLVVNEELSKKYNLEKRDGWMGSEMSKDLVVVVPENQKASDDSARGKVMKLSEAKKLVGTVYINE